MQSPLNYLKNDRIEPLVRMGDKYDQIPTLSSVPSFAVALIMTHAVYGYGGEKIWGNFTHYRLG